jgi:hypothetical protein
MMLESEARSSITPRAMTRPPSSTSISSPGLRLFQSKISKDIGVKESPPDSFGGDVVVKNSLE